MRKNLFQVTILFIVFLSVLVSCNKKEITDINNDFENPKEYIGRQHNEDLKFILENVNEKPQKNDIKLYVENILKKRQPENLKSAVTLSSIPDFPENIDNLNLNLWLDEFDISTELKTEISKTFELFRTAQSLTEILNEIKLKELNASHLFQGVDLELYYEHLAVAKYTSIFWYPEEEGGMNGIQYLNFSNLKVASSLKSAKVVNWWKVLGVDCVGGLMGGAVGYAGASAISVIMQL